MTRANVKWWVVAGAAFLVALACALWWLRPEVEASSDGAVSAGKEQGEHAARDARRQTARAGATLPNAGKDRRRDAGRPFVGKTIKDVPQAEEEVQPDEAEKLVGAFYDMTDKWLKPSKADVPMEAVEKFREQFNKVPRARKAECLQRALNLLPDANVMLLAGILLDKGQPAEYLELVYNDILNRDESVKKPLLKELFKDREHPCWATTAWILDVTGEIPGK